MGVSFVPPDHRELAFDGAAEFLTWLYDLDRRPWPLTREKHLPVVCLHVEENADGASRRILVALREHWTRLRLRGARQCVLVVPSEEETGRGVEQLLAAAMAQFSQRSRLIGRQRAPHFALASWLASLHRDRPATLSEDEVIAKIRDHHSGYELSYQEEQESRDAVVNVPLHTISGLPWWILLPAYLLPRAALRVAGNVFGPQRWFEHRGEGRRQATLRGELEPLKGSLFSLAKRCAGIEGKPPTQRQIDALLVDAFLQDLRRLYSRARILGRGRRRLTYPVLLVPCEDRPASTALLTAIADVRNGRPGRGSFKRDPLLVVATIPRAAGAPPGPNEQDPGSPESAYEQWRGELEAAGRLQREWLLPFTIPTDPPPRNVRDRVRRVEAPRRVPWMSFACVLVLIAALVAVPVTSHEFCRPWWSPSVRLWPPEVRDEMTREDLRDGVEQCVGLVGEDPALVSAELDGPVNLINQTNDKVVRNDNYLTVVYLTMLSPGTDQGVRATREELRGLAIAQQESLNDEAPIRVLLANAGARMAYAEQTAEEIVEADQRGQLDAVVGLGISTEQTVAAVRRLGRADLPAIGSATTAEELLDASPYYYQVSAGNQRQAEFAAEYAANDLGARRARVYYSADPNDTYSSELAGVMRTQLTDARIEVNEYEGYRSTDNGPGKNIAQLGREACQATERPDEIIVYAGRAEHFERFLNGMKLRCQNRYPRILATDDVSRFVLSGTNAQYPGLQLDYMALASSALWGTGCDAIKKQGSFYINYDKLFKRACDENRDGRALLAFDALAVVRQAAINVLRGDPQVLWSQGINSGLDDIAGDGAVSGVSGDLDYSDPDAPRTPVDKAIMVLRATAGQPCLVTVAGKFSSQPKIEGDCPPS